MRQFEIKNNESNTVFVVLFPEEVDGAEQRPPTILIGKDFQGCTWSGHTDEHDRRSCFRDRLIVDQFNRPSESKHARLLEVQMCICPRALNQTSPRIQQVHFKDVGYLIERHHEAVQLTELGRLPRGWKCDWCGHPNPVRMQLRGVGVCRRCRAFAKFLPAEEVLLEVAGARLINEPPMEAQVLFGSTMVETMLVALPVACKVDKPGQALSLGEHFLHRLELPFAVDTTEPTRLFGDRLKGVVETARCLSTRSTVDTAFAPESRRPMVGVLIPSRFVHWCNIRDQEGDVFRFAFRRPKHYLEFIWFVFRTLLSKKWLPSWSTFIVQPKDRLIIGQDGVSCCCAPTSWLDQLVACCITEISQARRYRLSDDAVTRLERLLSRVKVFRSGKLAKRRA